MTPSYPPVIAGRPKIAPIVGAMAVVVIVVFRDQTLATIAEALRGAK